MDETGVVDSVDEIGVVLVTELLPVGLIADAGVVEAVTERLEADGVVTCVLVADVEVVVRLTAVLLVVGSSVEEASTDPWMRNSGLALPLSPMTASWCQENAARNTQFNSRTMI